WAAEGFESGDVTRQTFGRLDGCVVGQAVALPDLGDAPPLGLASQERSRLRLPPERLAPRLLTFEKAGQNRFVAGWVLVLGMKPDLQMEVTGPAHELHLVVLPTVAAEPDLEVGARAVGLEVAQLGRQE